MNTAKHETQAGKALLAETPDLASTDMWHDAEDFFTSIYSPGTNTITHVDELSATPNGEKIAFTASTWHAFSDGGPSRRICTVDVAGPNKGVVQQITQGPHTDKRAKWSADGKTLAFLSDRARKGHFRVYAIPVAGLAEASLVTAGPVHGVIEDFEWSSDSKSMLYQLADYGMHISGAEGSGTVQRSDDTTAAVAAWRPKIQTAQPPKMHRSLWICDVAERTTRRVSRVGRNVWTFSWAGPCHAVALVSDSSVEGAHKDASVVQIDLSSGSEVCLRRAENGKLFGEYAALPDGSKVLLVESAGSERVKVVGNLVLIDTATQRRIPLATKNVDVGSLTWVGQHKFLAMGLRNMDAVALEIDVATAQATELWSTGDACGSTNGFARATSVPSRGFAVVRNSWTRAPEIGLVDAQAQYSVVKSFDHEGTQRLRTQLGERKTVTWLAADGTEIHGLLYLPTTGSAPYRTALAVHGGPFSAFTDSWLGYNYYIPWFVTKGYAVFCPNPRGSVGRGFAFTAAVKGDIGGVDAGDLLSGVDHLVGTGIADETRLGVFGGSYGGYMTAWLITQTTRFRAAIARSPISDYKLQWLCGDSRLPILGDEIYVQDSLAGSRRSPLSHIQNCTTPTLLIAGTQDTCTPPAHAQYLHTALVDLGVASVFIEYPEEGHGVSRFPAKIDSCCRALDWFDTYV